MKLSVSGVGVLCAVSAARAEVLKVFLLAGQSNMEGKGVANRSGDTLLNGTLAWQLDVDHSYLPVCPTMEPSPRVGCRAEGANFSGLYDEAAKQWVSFPKVFAAYKGSQDRNGSMTVGYGFRPEWIGPEYGFGKIMGEYYAARGGNRVLVLKVCWGGTDLEADWRPPSSGGVQGWCYSNMTQIVHKVLEEDLPELVPSFSYESDTYELVGFGWHQGWNDGCSERSSGDYEQNLANLIRDVRAEFKAPKLPVSIGLSGFDGWGQRVDRRLDVMAAQYNVTQHGDLSGSVAAVETRGFFRPFSETHGAINQGFHWFGNAETYFYIGTAMAEAMHRLIEGSWTQPYIDTRRPNSAVV